MTDRIRMGTRGSQLALAQSRWVQACLEKRWPGLEVVLVSITTAGDRFLEQPLSLIGGKGLFVKEIEDALTDGTIDCAVHSLKDVPNELAAGLVIAAIPPRADARDVLITRDGVGLDQLPRGARVGTSSLRRAALVRARRADLDITPLRGNVDTRLRKLDAGACDAVVLAAAALQRLGIQRSALQFFEPTEFIPAIGQGALAIETRDDDTVRCVIVLEDAVARVAVTAERAFLSRAGGSCHTPLAAHAVVQGDHVHMQGLIASPDGTRVLRGQRAGSAADAATLGDALAEELLDRGGAEILRALAAP